MDHAFERRVQWKLDFIIMQLNSVLAREARIMATVQELQAEVDQVVGVEASAVALLNGISQMLKDALASGNPQAIQDAIDKLEASKLGLAAAVAANTPPTP
jgi:orotate phosphoribosyltransferase-like protein